MNDDERDLDHADEQILSPQLRDETRCRHRGHDSNALHQPHTAETLLMRQARRTRRPRQHQGGSP